MTSDWLGFVVLGVPLALLAIMVRDAIKTRRIRKRAAPPVCADTGAPKHPSNCWNVRCQLGGTCCRALGVGGTDAA